MRWGLLIGAVVAVLVLWVAWDLWRTGRRIDRVHRRVVRTRVLLERALIRRASDVLALADSNLLGEESSTKLGAAARKSLAAVEGPLVADGLSGDSGDVGARYVTESELSEALKETVDKQTADNLENDPFGSQLLERVKASSYRVAMLRSVHNQDVTLCLDLRSRLDARLFHLAGQTPKPEYVDFDDAI